MAMVFILHLMGCLWATVYSISENDYATNWMIDINIQNNPDIDKYIAAFYWAAVTTLTVGYGDIVAKNPVEISANIIIALIAVSLYAYMFSKLSVLFQSVNDTLFVAKVRFIL